MSSMMRGRADQAYNNISNWFLWAGEYNGGYGGGSMSVNLGPSTMYQEAGGSPCNESPLGAAYEHPLLLANSDAFVNTA